MNTVQCSNAGFSLMIPSPAPKGDVRDSVGYVTLMRAGGCWDGAKQLLLMSVHSSTSYCDQVPEHLPKVLFRLPCQQ